MHGNWWAVETSGVSVKKKQSLTFKDLIMQIDDLRWFLAQTLTNTRDTPVYRCIIGPVLHSCFCNIFVWSLIHPFIFSNCFILWHKYSSSFIVVEDLKSLQYNISSCGFVCVLLLGYDYMETQIWQAVLKWLLCYCIPKC